MPLRAAGDGVEQFLRRERFRQVINRAGLDCFDREFRRGERRDHQHGQVGPLVFQLPEELVTAHAVEARIGDDHEEVLLLQKPQRLLGGIHRADFIAFVRHDGFQ